MTKARFRFIVKGIAFVILCLGWYAGISMFMGGSGPESAAGALLIAASSTRTVFVVIDVFDWLSDYYIGLNN